MLVVESIYIRVELMAAGTIEEILIPKIPKMWYYICVGYIT